MTSAIVLSLSRAGREWWNWRWMTRWRGSRDLFGGNMRVCFPKLLFNSQQESTSFRRIWRTSMLMPFSSPSPPPLQQPQSKLQNQNPIVVATDETMSSSGPYFRRLLLVIKQTAYEEYSQVILVVFRCRAMRVDDLLSVPLPAASVKLVNNTVSIHPLALI